MAINPKHIAILAAAIDDSRLDDIVTEAAEGMAAAANNAGPAGQIELLSELGWTVEDIAPIAAGGGPDVELPEIKDPRAGMTKTEHIHFTQGFALGISEMIANGYSVEATINASGLSVQEFKNCGVEAYDIERIQSCMPKSEEPSPPEHYAVQELGLKWRHMQDALLTCAEGGSVHWVNQFECVVPQDDAGKVTVAWPAGMGLDEEGKWNYLTSPFVLGGVTEVCHDQATNDGPEVFQLAIDNMIAGSKIFAEKYPEHFARMIAETGDANDADVWLQCCVFGEETFS